MNDMTPIQRLTRDLANASRTMSDAEARFLVDAYYQMQDARIRSDGQIQASIKRRSRWLTSTAKSSPSKSRTKS